MTPATYITVALCTAQNSSGQRIVLALRALEASP
jgi:hypothetical protein